MRQRLVAVSLIAALAAASSAPAQVSAHDQAGRNLCHDYPLVGYGLVAGLNDTGDHLRSSLPTLATLKLALQRAGNPEFDPAVYDGKVAVVMVTTTLRACVSADREPDVKIDRIPELRLSRVLDLTLTPMSDATSIRGGALLMTSLVGTDGRVYAVGQGSVVACPAGPWPKSACVKNGGLVAR